MEKVIKSNVDIEEILVFGYSIKGPRNDHEKDLKTFKIFVQKGKEFVTEDWLSSNNYKFVKPSTFTNFRRIAYKIIDDFPDERFSSNYSLVKDGKEIVLFLKQG